jgi:hypothetical protein
VPAQPIRAGAQGYGNVPVALSAHATAEPPWRRPAPRHAARRQARCRPRPCFDSTRPGAGRDGAGRGSRRTHPLRIGTAAPEHLTGESNHDAVPVRRSAALSETAPSDSWISAPAVGRPGGEPTWSFTTLTVSLSASRRRIVSTFGPRPGAPTRCGPHGTVGGSRRTACSLASFMRRRPCVARWDRRVHRREALPSDVVRRDLDQPPAVPGQRPHGSSGPVALASNAAAPLPVRVDGGVRGALTTTSG